MSAGKGQDKDVLYLLMHFAKIFFRTSEFMLGEFRATVI